MTATTDRCPGCHGSGIEMSGVTYAGMSEYVGCHECSPECPDDCGCRVSDDLTLIANEPVESCERCCAVLPPPYDRPEWAKSVAPRHPGATQSPDGSQGAPEGPRGAEGAGAPGRGGRVMTEPPIARYRLTLTIKGNTLDEIEDRLATQVNGGFLLDSDYGKRDSWNSTDGTTTSVMEHHNPDMTPERYAAELDAWWTARNAERKADANG